MKNIELERKQKWLEIKDKIDLFITKNPEGSSTEFFRQQPQVIRARYYDLKPDDYVWPGGKNKGVQKNPGNQKHYRAFRRNCNLPHNIIFEIMEKKMGLSLTQVPDDWALHRKEYIDQFKEHALEYADKQEKEKDISIFELPEPEPEPEPEPKKKDTQQAKIDAIMKLHMHTAEMIKELS